MTGELAAAFDLRGVEISSPRKVVLGSLSWRIPDRAVTLLLGPGGTGKSALLRALSGAPPSSGWAYQGTWIHRARRFHADTPAPPDPDVVWIAQQDAVPRAWRAALASRFSTVLIDEPKTCAPEERDELCASLRAHARRGAAVVVTHDLALARRAADRVALLVAGSLIADCDAPELFERPPNALARRFLEQGNCWPGSGGVPELPPHFCWVIPDRLAGMGKPGLLRREEDDLDAMAIAGINLLVSLTERPFPPELLRQHGMRGRHFPIPDMGVPSVGHTSRLCNELSRAIDAGERVAVHCHAGLGRTGTILAAILIWRGSDPERAIAELRATGRAYIQNEAQEQFVRHFAELG